MPPAEAVLSWAATVANEWRWLATLWHLALAAFAAVLVAGWRPSRRRFASLLVLPLVSVAAVALSSGNPFNGVVFVCLAAALGAAASRVSPAAPIRPARGLVPAGAALVAFGWLYPHFLVTDAWLAYAYASPFGLLPCPTLTVVIGFTLMCTGSLPRSWTVPVVAAGLFYGLVGIFVLRVALDVVLLIGAALLVIAAVNRAEPQDRTHREAA